MRPARALLTAALLVLATDAGAAYAQSNNNDYTPLNSRIRRDRPLPTEPRSIWQARDLSEAQRARSRTQTDQLARCLWNRSNQDGLDLLARTDFGFMSPDQIGMTGEDIMNQHAISNCLERVALNTNSSVMLRMDVASLRRWYLQAAYFDRYEDGPNWVRPGLVAGERSFPISATNAAVRDAMVFADCVVAADPYGADFFFRTAAGTEQETASIQALVPAIGSCLPQGQELEIDPFSMRQWIGEGLWHAATASTAGVAEE